MLGSAASFLCNTVFLFKYYCSIQPYSLQPHKYTVPENTSINVPLSSLPRCLVTDEIHLQPIVRPQLKKRACNCYKYMP